MESNAKYKSYFWNEQVQKKEDEQNNLYKNAPKEDSSINVLFHIGFSVLFVIVFAFGLRAVEGAFFTPNAPFNKHLIINTVMAAENPNQATLVDQSHELVNIKPDGAFTFTLKYKNSGSSTWTKSNVYLKSSTTALKFRHDFWPDPYLPAQMKESSVEPGEIGTFVFALQAPKNYKEYVGEFILVNDNVMISGGKTEVTMNVVEDPSSVQSQQKPAEEVATENTNKETSNQICTLNLSIANGITEADNTTCVVKFGLPEKGPEIRVGLFHTEETISIKNDKAWQIYDETDNLLGSINANQTINFYYIDTKGEYVFDLPDKTIRTNAYLKLNNFNDGLFTITSFEDIPSWNKSINFNDFTGDLELRYNSAGDRTWLIEIIPLEDYIAGIKETSNPDPIEYLKTMAVAARTYALYHHNRGGKHPNEYFDLNASEGDQVYKGQVVSVVMPKHAQAVTETAGIIATFEDEIIVASYFARSDGRTRSFEEVWNRHVPYLVSVPAPYNEGRTLWGHGVGIDATDARAHAREDDWKYDQILKYYYTGVELEQIY